MKSKKSVKTIKIIAASIILIYVISLSVIYDFWSNAHYLFNSDDRKIYGTVCKNIDFKEQKIVYFEITSNDIRATIKKHYFAVPSLLLYGIFYFIDPDPFADINGMFRMYEELSIYNKPVYISIGARGSSDSEYDLLDGSLIIKEYSAYAAYALEAAMLRNDIDRIYIDNFSLEEIEDELPENYSIKHLFCCVDYHGTDNISKFKGLQSLDLCIYDRENNADSYFNLEFLNDMPQLETLILHGYVDLFDFSDGQYAGVKKVILHTNEYGEALENDLHNAFPDAEIEIAYDYPGYYAYWSVPA